MRGGVKEGEGKEEENVKREPSCWLGSGCEEELAEALFLGTRFSGPSMSGHDRGGLEGGGASCRRGGGGGGAREAGSRRWAVLCFVLMQALVSLAPGAWGQAPGGQWSATPNLAGSVRGGSLLTIYGAGFDAGQPYRVEFKGTNENDDRSDGAEYVIATSEPAYPDQPGGRIVFGVPEWEGHEGVVTLRLMGGDGVSIAPLQGAVPSFEYLSEWHAAEGSYPTVFYPPTDVASSFAGASPTGACYPFGSVRCASPGGGGPAVKIRGRSFQRRECPDDDFCRDSTYVLRVSSIADPSLPAVLSSPATPSSSTEVTFTVPAWPFAPGKARIELLRGGVVRPLLPGVGQGEVTYLAEYTSVTPASSIMSGGAANLLRVQGRGFEYGAVYHCVFFRQNSTGMSMLAEERAVVRATYLGPTELACDTSQLTLPSGWSPTWDRNFTSPQKYLAADAEFAASAPSAVRGWGALYPNLGPVNLTVTQQGNHQSMMVGSTGARETPPYLDVFGLFVPMAPRHGSSGALQVTDSRYDGTWHSPNVSQASAFGGSSVQVRVAGVRATYMPENRTLTAASPTNVSQLASFANSSFSGGGVEYPGVMFDLLVKRSVSVKSLSVAATTAGAQTFWVYKRDGTSRGYEVGYPAVSGWTLVGGGAITVVVQGDNNSPATAKVAELALDPPLALKGGSLVGLFIVAANGVRYSVSGEAYDASARGCCGDFEQNHMSCCRNGCGRTPCANATSFSDSFISISSGRIVGARSGATLSVIAEFTQKYGDAANPRFFAGSVNYANTRLGSDYYCRFTMGSETGSYAQVTSMTIMAMAVSPNLLSVSTSMTCKVPQWGTTEAHPFCLGAAVPGELHMCAYPYTHTDTDYRSNHPRKHAHQHQEMRCTRAQAPS